MIPLGATRRESGRPKMPRDSGLNGEMRNQSSPALEKGKKMGYRCYFCGPVCKAPYGHAWQWERDPEIKKDTSVSSLSEEKKDERPH